MHLLSRILLCTAACSVLAFPQADDNSKTDTFGDQGELIMPVLPAFPSFKTLNIEKKFSRWPKRTRIPYALHPSYSPSEATLIRSGVAQIMADLNFWITLVNVPVNGSEYKILITPLKTDDVTPEVFCYSFPGMLSIAPQLATQGIREQRLVIARGPSGCLDGTIHSVMKHLVVVLGKRNEHERGDRGKFIQLLPENLSSAGKNAYRLYSSTEAIWLLFPYDYCSITHASQTEFALPGKLAFMVLQEPFFIPILNRLSETDCRLLLMLYSGDPSACSPLVCASLTGVRLTTSAPPASSTNPSTSSTSTSTSTIGSTSTVKPLTTTPFPTTTESTTNGITTVCYSFPTQPNTSPITSSSTTMMTLPVSQIKSSSTTIEATNSPTTVTSSLSAVTSVSSILPLTEISLTERGESVACPESFCSIKIDHASLYWDGTTSLLFSGNCTQKISNSFQLIGSPMSIADALPGGLIFGTVQSAWTNLELGQYRLHVIDRAGIQRSCSETACVREDPKSPTSPTGSLFSVQSGQSQVFRMFSLDGSSKIIDLTREQIPIAISPANGVRSASILARIDTAWMFYNIEGENTVAVIGSDHTGKQYIGEVEADLTKSPATFKFKNSPPIMPINSKLLPCA